MLAYILIVFAVLQMLGLLLLWRRLDARTPLTQPAASAPVPDAEPERRIVGVDEAALIGVLKRLEIRLGDIEDHVRHAPTMPNEVGQTADRAYTLAQRLARQGATAQQIAETCGLSLSEAELLHRLHAGNPS
ncbi:DUF2802 domain-containing protein [Luteibacter rhizovicinus]|nr:DUF2802 domain-containing protein [Luteibacter rhizovicinus]